MKEVAYLLVGIGAGIAWYRFLLSIRLVKFHVPCAITANLKFRKNKFLKERSSVYFLGGLGTGIGFLGPGAPPPSCLMLGGNGEGLDEGLEVGL